MTQATKRDIQSTIRVYDASCYGVTFKTTLDARRITGNLMKVMRTTRTAKKYYNDMAQWGLIERCAVFHMKDNY